MREIATVLGGIGLLIFAYLIVTNYAAIGPVLGAATGALTDTIMTLQGGKQAQFTAPSFGGTSTGGLT